MGQYRNYTDEDFTKAVKNNKSIAGVLKEIGLIVAGGNYNQAKKNIARLNLNTDHFTGQLWSKGHRQKDWSEYSGISRVKVNLLKERGHQCEKCKEKTWQDEQIPIELHHIDGNRTNNEPENLSLLCCNCHALTDNWRGRGQKKRKSTAKIYLCECGEKKYSTSKRCISCANRDKAKNRIKKAHFCECGEKIKARSKTGRCRICYDKDRSSHIPSANQLLKDKKELVSNIQIAKKYQVSDNAIKHWFKKRKLT